MLRKLGCFTTFISILFLSYFLLSDLEGQPELNYFCVGVLLLLGGVFLWKRGTPQQQSKYFRLLRKHFGSDGENEQSKDNLQNRQD